MADKWADSIVIGLDSSQNMIEKAKKDYPNQIWIHDKAENITDGEKYSLVFSNASLQWMDNHEILIPKLWKIVDNGGVFAAQIPRFEIMPINIAIHNVLEKKKWNKCKENDYWSNRLHGLDYYYELLSRFTEKIVLWVTNYYHILPSLQAIIDFIHTTALKPYLDKLETDNDKQEFNEDILFECKKYYKEQSNGKVLFPFERMFIIAYKK